MKQQITMASPVSEQSRALAARHVGMCRRQERDFPKKRRFTLWNQAKKEWSRMEGYGKRVDGHWRGVEWMG